MDIIYPCVKQQVVAVLLARDGQIFVGTNGINVKQEKCPREGLPTGVGYDKCKDICQQYGHAEIDAVTQAKAVGKSEGANVFVYGHTYCCDNCLKVMKESGVMNVYIMKGEWRP